VRALQAGEAHRFPRAELPDWHPLRLSGAPGDALGLTEHDDLIEVS
jgi:hypothetical protein